MAKHGQIETRVSLILPLGAVPQHKSSQTGVSQDTQVEQTMNKTQFEDVMVYLARVDAKAPDALADLINLKQAPEFNCASCYAVGEHKDACKYDCPQAQEHAVWALGRQQEDR